MLPSPLYGSASRICLKDRRRWSETALASVHTPATTLSIPGGADLIVAVATVDRSVTTGLEGYFCILATFRADDRKHLAPWSESETFVLLTLFPRLATRRAAFGIVLVAFGGEELLFFSTEGEGRTAIAALERPVLINHWMTPLFEYSARVLVIQY